MIITCEACTTRFKLDDARIPETGAKVRCSKCKHAFFVKPQATAADPVVDVVSRTLADDDVDTKEITAPDGAAVEGSASPGDSLTGPLRSPGDSATAGIPGPGDSATGLRAPDTQTAQEAIDEYDESDWEFNTEDPDARGPAGSPEPPGSGDAARGGGEPRRDPDAPAAPRAEASGVAPDGPGRADEAPEPQRVDAAAEAVDDLLGAVDDEDDDEDFFDTSPLAVELGINALLGGSADESAGPGGEPGPALPPTPEPVAPEPVDDALDAIGLDRGGPESASGAAASAASGLEVGAPLPEELGEPGDWDFFAEEAEVERGPGPAATPPLVIGRLGRTAAESRPPVAVDAEPSRAGVWARRAGAGVGWAALCALTALTLHQALGTAPRAADGAPRVQRLAGLQASSIEGRWLENRAGDSLFVVSGELRAAPGEPEPGARLAVRLLDAAGRPLVEDAAAVGPERPMGALREQDPEALRAYQADGALALAGYAAVSGRPVRIAAVVDELPTPATRFELTTIRDAPPAPRAVPGDPTGPAGSPAEAAPARADAASGAGPGAQAPAASPAQAGPGAEAPAASPAQANAPPRDAS